MFLKEKSKEITNDQIYYELGLDTVIHAAGTKTTHGGTRLSPTVLNAMVKASKGFTNIVELNKSIGRYIASITGSEAGMVTGGAGSGVVLSVAACMTGTNIAKVKQLPDSTGMKNEVIMQKIHRGSYSKMYEFSGAKIVEIGNINDCVIEELEHAISDKTAAISYLFGPRISKIGLSLRDMSKLSQKYNIPLIVDAAAAIPPKSNLKRFIEEGADLVTISGGKIIHGPQGTGIMYGKKHLIDSAIMNNSPNYAIGRCHKVSKEDMVGLYVAIKEFMEKDEEEMFDEFRHRLIPAFNYLKTFNNLRVDIVHDWVNYNVPVLTIKFDSSWKGPDPSKFPSLMISEKPKVFLQYFKELDDLVINPISLKQDEAMIVAKKIGKIIKMEGNH